MRAGRIASGTRRPAYLLRHRLAAVICRRRWSRSDPTTAPPSRVPTSCSRMRPGRPPVTSRRRVSRWTGSTENSVTCWPIPHNATPPAADRARAAAQQRCDDLVTSAKSRFDADSAVLMAELAALDPQLPPAMASWASPAWNRANSPSVGGLRIGELFAPERGDLRLPFCVPTPIARPLWVLDAGDPVLPVVTSLVLRLVVAARVPFPGMRNSSTGGQVLIDVFDLTGSLAPMTEMLMPMLTAPAVTAPESVADRLSVLESSIDLTQMALQAREVDDIDTRVVVIADLPFGWDVAALARLVRIADRGSELGWAFVFAGSLDDSDNDPLVSTIADRTMMIPVTDEARAHDPWVGLPWSVAAERIDPTGTQARQIVATLSSDQPRSGANPNA